MITALFLSVIFLGVAMFGMALSIIFKKQGRFPAFKVGHNKQMKKMGITCVRHDEIKCHKKFLKEQECAGCGGSFD